jgi:CubicO group peptidase (beta-lactamase class C family)
MLTALLLATLLQTAVVQEPVDTTIRRVMTAGDVPGLAIAIIRRGQPHWVQVYGVANAKTHEPTLPSTVFEAASLSKPVFTYAVLKLVDADLINLDTPLNQFVRAYDFVPSTPAARIEQITARRVLTHTTGLENWRRDSLRIFFEPGARFSYSGEGFVYLQRAVENITGENFDSLMNRLVFKPLGMSSSSFSWRADYASRKAYGHSQLGEVTGRRERRPALAAATLHTTAADYAQFLSAVLNGEGLSPASRALMTTPQVWVDPACSQCARATTNGRSDNIAWTFGWGFQKNNAGTQIWHWGDNGEMKAFVIGDLASGRGTVVFTNGANGLGIMPEIVRTVMGNDHPSLAWIRYPGYAEPSRMLLKEIALRGLPAFEDYVQRRDRGGLRLNEQQINSIGYGVLRRKQFAEAIAIFQLNVRDYPNSANTYDSLAEAYMEAGRKEEAIRNYQRSLELDPNNPNAVAMLKRLGVGN